MKKVVLVSVSGYNDTHDDLLRSFIDSKVELFCVVGEQCELWHDVMDDFLVGREGDIEWDMLTTWHDNESVEEVIEFAKYFEGKDGADVQVIKV